MKTILMIQISKQGAIAYQKMKQNGITHATKTRTIPPVLLDSETCKRRFPKSWLLSIYEGSSNHDFRVSADCCVPEFDTVTYDLALASTIYCGYMIYHANMVEGSVIGFGNIPCLLYS